MCCAEVFSPCGLCWLFSCHLLRQIWMFAFWYEVTLSVKGPVRRLSGTHAQIKFSSYELIDFVAAVKFRLCGWCNDFVMCLCVTFRRNPSLWLVLASARGLGEGSTSSSHLYKCNTHEVWGVGLRDTASSVCDVSNVVWCGQCGVLWCHLIWYYDVWCTMGCDVEFNLWCVMCDAICNVGI